MRPELMLLTPFFILPAVLGVALAQGKMGATFFQALDFQPRAYNALQRMLMISFAIVETGGILSLVIWATAQTSTLESGYHAWSYIGAILAMAIPGCIASFGSTYPIEEALRATARQPHMAQAFMRFLLLVLSFIQTPLIFSTIISWFIIGQEAPEHVADVLRLIAAGGTLAFATIGPLIGLSRFTSATCTMLGKHRKAYNNLISFTFISQAILETPILLALVISLFLLFFTPQALVTSYGITYLLAMVCIAGTTCGPGLSSSQTAIATCKSIPHYPDAYRGLVRTSVLAQTLIDTTVIYGLIISFFLIYR